MLRALRRHICENLSDRRGLAAVEFAMMMPILVTLLLATVEIGRYAILYQKLDRTANTMADLVSQSQTITNTDINNLLAAVPNIMTPFSSTTLRKIIVSQVGLVSGVAKVNWQRSGAGTYAGTSKIGVQGGNATLPAGFTVTATESLIVAEVYYNFSPFIFAPVAPAKVLYRPAYYRPRIGDLETVQ
jgi:Flp pilus assembly protein TadG